MSQDLIRYLENNSLNLLNDTLGDVRANAGPALSTISDDDMKVALYTAILKIIDALRSESAIDQGCLLYTSPSPRDS